MWQTTKEEFNVVSKLLQSNNIMTVRATLPLLIRGCEERLILTVQVGIGDRSCAVDNSAHWVYSVQYS
jgi:hypothetical protein